MKKILLPIMLLMMFLMTGCGGEEKTAEPAKNSAPEKVAEKILNRQQLPLPQKKI